MVQRNSTSWVLTVGSSSHQLLLQAGDALPLLLRLALVLVCWLECLHHFASELCNSMPQ